MATIALDYHGDCVVNAMADIAFTALGILTAVVRRSGSPPRCSSRPNSGT